MTTSHLNSSGKVSSFRHRRRRHKSSDPFFVSEQYAELLSRIASPDYRIFDTLRDAAELCGLSSHPITLGDVRFKPDGKTIEPAEQLLTDELEFTARQVISFNLII